MTIDFLTIMDVNASLKSQIHILYKQLNADIVQLDIEEVLNQGNKFQIACCWDEGALIGMASIATYKVISGYKGMIEDVVVSNNRRGEGIGRKLMESLISKSKELGLTELLLFSGNLRIPAIQLYKSLGFVQKESGIFTMKHRSI